MTVSWRWYGLASIFLIGVSLVSCTPLGETEIPTAPTADADAARQMIAHINDDAWEQLSGMFPEAIRPEVEQVRVVSPSEWNEVIAQCVKGQGFAASANPDGGISYGAIPDEQAEAQNLAVYVCRVKYPIDPSFSLPLTTDEASFIYEYYKNTLVPCLSSHGYEVEMPSESVFGDILKTEGSPWSPYGDLQEVEGAALDTLLVECPQTPSGFRGGP